MKGKFRAFFKDKRGQFDGMNKLAIGGLTLGIVLVVLFLVISQGLSQIGTIEGVNTANKNLTECGSSISCNATTSLQSAYADIPNWVPLIILTGIGGILLSLVSFFTKRRR